MALLEHEICRLCGARSNQFGVARLLDMDIAYMKCTGCEYVQTERPYWLDKAYENSINASDTGIMQRNLRNARIVVATLLAIGAARQRVVDVAGGYGILTRLLRDLGVDAFWTDAYSPNLVARGFEHDNSPAELVTAFESFEHFVNPGIELDKMLTIAPSVLISTEVLPEPTPTPTDWWYYGLEHGQHIGFYTVHSLRTLAESRGKHLLTDGRSYHLFSTKKINSNIWRSYLRLKRPITALMASKWKSKTWDDHLYMTTRTRASQQINRRSRRDENN